MTLQLTRFVAGLGPSALSLLLLVLWSADAPGASSGARPPWEAMDYGPFLTASIEAPEPRRNIAYKGIAINLAVLDHLFARDLKPQGSDWWSAK